MLANGARRCKSARALAPLQQRLLSSGASGSAQRECVAYRLGLVEYETAWDWQKKLIQERIAAARQEQPIAHDAVLMLQHPSVYTLGRGATMDNVKFDPEKDDCKLIRVDRGGEVTYHGPGQLVVYPILDLAHYKKDLHWYLRQVEEVAIQTLAKIGIQGERVDGLTGVWVRENNDSDEMRKIAAVGTHASRWFTMHGFAINVTTDLSAFNRIIPCGIDDRAVTSVELKQPHVTLADVEKATVESLVKVFDMRVSLVESKTPF